MVTSLKYTLSKTRTDMPLVSIDSELGNGQEFDPSVLRKLANVLNKIADEAERHDLGMHYQQRKITVEI